MTLIILTSGIDLSVGAAMSLSAVALGLGLESGKPAGLCVLLALLTGSAAGFVNGVFVAKVKVFPLIVTLATLSAFHGLAEGWSHARPISGFPPEMGLTIGGSVGPVVIVCVASVLAMTFLAKTEWGQALYAMGTNELATRFSGVKVDRIKLLIYTLAGTAAGLAAVFYAARRNTVKADVGQGLELDVVTAVVLGGTSIYGGKGTIVGTLLGVLLVHETRQFVSWHWERDELNLIVIGSLLLLSVVGNRLFSRSQERTQ